MINVLLLAGIIFLVGRKAIAGIFRSRREKIDRELTEARNRFAALEKNLIALVQEFAELGCEAKVKEMRSIEDGKEFTAWVTIITTTPAHFWEISGSLEEKLHVEQLYQSVDIRFNTVVWPEG